MSYRKKILKELATIEARIKKMYVNCFYEVATIRDLSNAIEKGDKDFSFDKYKNVSARIDNILQALSINISTLLSSSIKTIYTYGGASVKNTLYSTFVGKNGIDKKQIDAISDTAKKDLLKSNKNNYLTKIKEAHGMQLSDRVWKNTISSKKEIEIAVKNAITEGSSADRLAKELQKTLNEPKRLFRSVRNKDTGELELSKEAKMYKTGRGVYRSSYKNAMRLARTEINKSYRQGEWDSYQYNPLITGYRIALSNNHTTLKKGKAVRLKDVCDELQGIYPKTYRWTGWHPQCRCVMIPIIINDNDFAKRQKALSKGTADEWQSKSTVSKLPKNYRNFMENNKDRFANRAPAFTMQ